MFLIDRVRRRRIEQIWRQAELDAIRAKAAAFDTIVRIRLAEQVTARQMYRAVEPRSFIDSWRWSS